MKKLFRVWAPIAAFSGATLLPAQTSIDLRTQTKSVDFSSAVSTRPSKVGTALPATCSTGETFFKSDAPAGQNLYGCTANVWTQLGSSEGGGSAVLTAVSYSATPTFTVSAGSASQVFTMALTGDVTSSTLVTTNAEAGEQIGFILTQDGLGSHSFTWPSNVIGACTISAAGGASTMVNGIFDGTNVVNPSCRTSAAWNGIGSTESSTAPTPAAGLDLLFADSSTHSFKISNNGAAAQPVVIAPASTTPTEALFATATAGAPAFRAITPADIPTLNQNTTGTAANVTGIVAEANGGTGANNTPGAVGHVLRSNGTHYADSAIQAADVPTLNQNTTGTAAGLSAAYIDWNASSGGAFIQNKPSTFAPSAHNLLSSAHADTTASPAVRGGAIFAAGATPTWTQVAHSATTGGYWKWNGTDVVASSGAAAGTGSCTNQVVTAENADAGPTCATITSASVDGSIAKTGTDINTGGQVTATHLASPMPVAQGGTGLATLTAHALYAGNGANTLNPVGPDSGTTHFLASGGSLADPTFRAIAAADLPAALANTTSVNGTPIPASVILAQTIANGTAAMGTSALSSSSCATVISVAATGVLSTDILTASFNGDPTAVTGYVPATTGMLTIIMYPSAGYVNFKVCNNTSSSITPGALTLNWRVVR